MRRKTAKKRGGRETDREKRLIGTIVLWEKNDPISVDHDKLIVRSLFTLTVYISRLIKIRTGRYMMREKKRERESLPLDNYHPGRYPRSSKQVSQL